MTDESPQDQPQIDRTIELFSLESQILRAAIIRHRDFLTSQRAKIAAAVPTAAVDIDSHLSIITARLFPLLGVDEDEDGKAKAATDPRQIDMLDGEPDRRTHEFSNVRQTRELVTRLVKEAPTPAAAVNALNRLEEGEKLRVGGARQNHMEAIESARSTQSRKVVSIDRNAPPAETPPAGSSESTNEETTDGESSEG